MLDESSSTAGWKLRIYRVQDRVHQQRILTTFLRLGWPGVTVLGTQSGRDWFVIIECSAPTDDIRTSRIVMTIDPLATRTHECKGSPTLVPFRRD